MSAKLSVHLVNLPVNYGIPIWVDLLWLLDNAHLSKGYKFVYYGAKCIPSTRCHCNQSHGLNPLLCSPLCKPILLSLPISCDLCCSTWAPEVPLTHHRWLWLVHPYCRATFDIWSLFEHPLNCGQTEQAIYSVPTCWEIFAIFRWENCV